jgi:hypothetical protein
MTKKVKPDKPIGFEKQSNKKPIGFDIEPPENTEPYVSVGFQFTDSVSLPESEPIQEAYQRESDSDQSPESFNEITGEFIKIPKKVSIKPIIRAAVDNSLRSIGKARSAPSRVMRC